MLLERLLCFLYQQKHEWMLDSKITNGTITIVSALHYTSQSRGCGMGYPQFKKTTAKRCVECVWLKQWLATFTENGPMFVFTFVTEKYFISFLAEKVL